MNAVFLPTALRSYTDNRATVEANGATVAAVLDDLERRYPGIRFRMIDEQGAIRQHIKIFVGEVRAGTLDVPVKDDEDVIILTAISGG